ncbi:DUF3987 domain-containing protein [Sphingomonas aerolata]|uniref:DUF3987 domain-containing protein n=1 Tax=Sphingomonas aerolata TaxID=185951 RepID=UPI0033446408
MSEAKVVDGVTYDPAFFAQAEQKSERAKAEHEAHLAEQLASATAEAPNGGAYVADGHASPAQGALPMPPGFVGALARFIYQQAPLPVAEVAIVGALGLMAGIAGRVWHTPAPHSGLNLYVVLVARSAIGKEAMHSGIAKLLDAANREYPEAGLHADFSDFVSGPALLKACAQNPCFVNVAGEIGHKFLAMSVGQDSSMRSLRKVLTTLYAKSGPGSIAGGITYSSQENNVGATQAVAFSLIGETTPGTFYESITDEMMRDGFMSRFCVIEYTGDRPDRNSAPMQAPPKPLVDHMLRIVRHAGLAAATDKFQEVALNEPARALLDGFYDECHRAIIAAGDDERQRAVWNRAHLNALRVAALLAVGDQYFKPIVTEEQANWAITLLRHGIASFLDRLKAGEVGEGTDGGRERKVLDLCGKFLRPGGKFPPWLKDGEKMRLSGIVPRKYLQQKTQRLSAFDKHKIGHTAALNMTIKTAIANGNLIEVKKEALVEQYGFFGHAYRVLSLN